MTDSSLPLHLCLGLVDFLTARILLALIGFLITERPPHLNLRHLYTPRYTPRQDPLWPSCPDSLPLLPQSHWNRLSRGRFSPSLTPDPSSSRLPLDSQLLSFLFPPVVEPSSALVYSAPNKWLPLTNPFPPLPASENLPASPSLACFIVVFFPRLLKILFVPVSQSEHRPPARRQ